MSHYHHFDNCFDGFKDAARDFGDYMRDMAGEAGWKGQGGPFGRNWGGHFDRHFADLFSPRANIYTTQNGSLVFEFMLPGIDESAINLSFSGDTMILKAQAPEEGAEQETRRYEMRRFVIRDIDRREYSVPADRYDQAAVRASYRHGILTVTVPRREGAAETEGIKVEIQREGN